jgi:hypothetical protein
MLSGNVTISSQALATALGRDAWTEGSALPESPRDGIGTEVAKVKI